MKVKTLLQVAGTIFTIIFVLHALRLVFAWPAQIGSITIPVWLSALGAGISCWLAYECWKLSK